MAYDWEYHSETTLSGDWSSVADPSGVITQTTTAAAVHEGTKGLAMSTPARVAGYLAKTGLPGSTGFIYRSWFKLSSDFSMTTISGKPRIRCLAPAKFNGH